MAWRCSTRVKWARLARLSRRYMDAAGADAQYSEESLVLLVKVKQADDAAFAHVGKANTLKAYQEYLAAFPKAYHLEEARGRMAGLDQEAFLRAQAQDTLASYQDYLRAYPEGGHVAEARLRRRELDADNKAFARAESEGTVASFQAYLDANPRESTSRPRSAARVNSWPRRWTGQRSRRPEGSIRWCVREVPFVPNGAGSTVPRRSSGSPFCRTTRRLPERKQRVPRHRTRRI